MTKYREILRLKSLGFSERNIAQSCGVSRNTVAKVLKKAAEIKLSWPLDFDMTDSALEELMFPKDKSATNKRMPNFDYIRKELLRNGVNKKLLWVEYCEECRMSSEEPLMYSQFCYYIQKDEEKRRATMHIPRKPGEQIEVDWAGDPAHIIDPDTGEITDAWIFVGVLTYSQYAFVKAYMNEKTDNWIKAHVQMFDFFGGVTPMLVSDNCTTAVNHKKSDWYNTALNTTYHEMAEHYNLAILPARIRKPKDKPNVEGSVGKISTWITAALRNEQFFSLAELNASIREKLDAYFEGTKVQMSKRGSAIARRVIHTLTLQSISISRNGEAKNPVLREYYLKKCDSKPKLVAMGAVSHKVCNMIFAILRDNKPFKIIAPQEHIKQYNAAKCDIAA